MRKTKSKRRESKKFIKVVLTEDFYVPGEDVILEPGDTLYIDPYTEEGGQNPPETNVAAIDNPEAELKQTDNGTFTEDELDWVDADDVLEGDDCPDCDDDEWTADDEDDYIEACRRRAAARKRASARRRACNRR